MSDTAIVVENLGKMYRIGKAVQRPANTREALVRGLASPFDYLKRKIQGPSEDEILWALRDVSFEVKEGEVLGIIGRNGAGKSTLLKILSRITEPTTGHAEIRGRVNSLLEVGTGFHPELTGRENIYMNAAMHGMKRREINAKLDEIIAFAEVEKFIDTPVKRYSSGMYTRLAFAVAAHLEPDILIVDEVLAVGDAEFQKKCLGKMQDVAGQGRTVLFVSHNIAFVSSLCDNCILLYNGRIGLHDSVEIVVAKYHCSEDLIINSNGDRISNDFHRIGTCKAIKRLRVYNERNEITRKIHSGEQVTVEFDFEIPYQLKPLCIGIGFDRIETGRIASLNNYITYTNNVPIAASKGTAVFKINKFCLSEGIYSISPSLARGQVEIVDMVECCYSIEVIEPRENITPFRPMRGHGYVILDAELSLKPCIQQ